MSEERLVEMALARHPRILSARARVVAGTNRVSQAWALDDPLLSNSIFPFSGHALQTAAGRAGSTLSLSQKYPWPEKRRTKATIADREAKISVARLRQTELEIEESTRLAYYDLWFANQAIGILENDRRIAAQLVELAEARNAAGGSQQDIIRAQLQLDFLDDRLIALRRQKAVSQADIAALVVEPEAVGVESAEQLRLQKPLDPVSAMFAASLRCSPRLQEQNWAVSRDREKQRLAKLSNYPDFVLGAGWQTMTESDALSGSANGRDNISIMAGLTLPIWRGRIQSAIREAAADKDASARGLADARDDTYRQIRRLSEDAHAADKQLELYQQRILPRAKLALRLATSEYRSQLVDFGELADGFTEVLQFELQVARSSATLAGAVAQLHRVIGC